MASCVRVFAGIWVSAILLIPAPAEAQVLYGSIVGTVTDASNAAMAEATVTAINKQTGQQRQAATNESGGFTFVAVQPGIYEVKAVKNGFRPLADQNVEVTSNNTTRVDMSLQVGSVNEAITVESSLASLQTDSANVRAEVTSRELINVPTPVGRNYQNMFVTIPGFSPPQNAHSTPTNPSRALQANVNGTPSAGVSVRIDGASSQQTWLPHIAAYVPALEAIETVNVVTNSFSAEQGLAGGASINVQVKSGTNEIHGSGFWYHNDNALLAKPFTFGLQRRDDRNPKYVFNQPGGTIGGAIIKNKLFYFGSYEASTRRELASKSGTLPTDAMRNGNFSDGQTIYQARGIIYDPATGDPATGAGRTPFANNVIPTNRISPIAQKIIGFMPSVPTGAFADNNFFAFAGFLFDRHTVDTKINYNVNEKWTMYGRYSVLNYSMNNPGMLGALQGPYISDSGGNTGNASGTTHSLTYATTYVINPRLIFDANFGYTLYNTKVEQPDLDRNIGLDVLGIPGTNGERRLEGGWPRFTFNGFTTMGVNDAFMPYTRRDPQFQYVGNLNWTKGRHQIRFGADIYRQDLNHIQAEFAGQNHGASGGFRFDTGPTQVLGGASGSPYNSWASFLLGLPSNYGTTYQVPDEYGAKTYMYSAYIQDTWQVNSKLTLNIGTRYENIPMPRRSDGRGMERYDFVNNKMLICGFGSVPTDCGTKNSNLLFAPRIGIAYRPTEKTVIRTGFGLNWDPLNLVRGLRTNYPMMIILNSPTPASQLIPVSRIEDGIPAAVVPSLGNGIIDIPTNYAVQSTGDSFKRAYILSWNFTIQHQLPRGFTIQAGYVGNRTVRQTNFIDLNAGQTIGTGSAGQPFNAPFKRTVGTTLIDSVGHTKYDSLQTTLTRRFDNGLSLNFAYTFSKAIGICCNTDNAGGPQIQALAFQNLNRSVSTFDRPHNFQSTFVYELPFGKGKALARGRVASALLGGWQVNGLLSAYSGAPFSVNANGTSLNMPGNNVVGGSALNRADVVGPIRKLGGTGTGQAFYDWTSFRPVSDARWGTSGFNILRGPRIVNMDVGLFRRFSITERFNVQFRAEALNVSNTMQLANPVDASKNISSLRVDGNGNYQGGTFEVTTAANTGRDGLVQRALRLGVRIGF